MKIHSCKPFCVPEKACPHAIAEAIAVLKDGGVVAHPTDTCYGLAVDIMNETALRTLYDLKKMPYEKPVSILVRSFDEAQRYGQFSKLALRLAGDFWPGPLTLVVPRIDALPQFLNPKSTHVGIRLVDEPITMGMLNAFEGPLTTTSANLHGETSPYSIEEISLEPDLLIDVGSLVEHSKPSTVIRVDGQEATTLRRGDLFELYNRLI